MKKRIIAIVINIFCVFKLGSIALAAWTQPDGGGSITAVFEHGISDETRQLCKVDIRLYRVADLLYVDGGYAYAPVAAIADISGLDLDIGDDAGKHRTQAGLLQSYLMQDGFLLPYQSISRSSDVYVYEELVFDGLDEGLYLLVNMPANDDGIGNEGGYASDGETSGSSIALVPALIPLPYIADTGAQEFHIMAWPKTSPPALVPQAPPSPPPNLPNLPLDNSPQNETATVEIEAYQKMPQNGVYDDNGMQLSDFFQDENGREREFEHEHEREREHEFDLELDDEMRLPGFFIPFFDIPRTGLLIWPIPILCTIGLLFIGIGYYNMRKRIDN